LTAIVTFRKTITAFCYKRMCRIAENTPLEPHKWQTGITISIMLRN